MHLEEYTHADFTESGDKCSNCGSYMLKSPVDDRNGSYNWTWYCENCGNTESE